jgi:hypothetical protein
MKASKFSDAQKAFILKQGNLAALHPADPIKRRTSAQRTQAPESVDTRRASALDPLENTIRRFQPSASRK